jgi:hypothetical protein
MEIRTTSRGEGALSKNEYYTPYFFQLILPFRLLLIQLHPPPSTHIKPGYFEITQNNSLVIFEGKGLLHSSHPSAELSFVIVVLGIDALLVPTLGITYNTNDYSATLFSTARHPSVQVVQVS